MHTFPEIRRNLGNFIGKRLHPAANIETHPRPETPPALHSFDPQHLTDPDIAWDKFIRYLAPLPGSLAMMTDDRVHFGDVYTTTRVSGIPLDIVPLYITEWKSKHELDDMLLLLAFNPKNQVVGMRTVEMRLDEGEAIYSHGAIASAICNDGIASALEEVRDRVSQEVLMRQIRSGRRFHGVIHTIQDENIEICDNLQKRVEETPADPVIQTRFTHALNDRPRWETLFTSGSARRVTNNRFEIPRNDELSRGFCGDTQVVYEGTKSKVDGSTFWNFRNLGTKNLDQFFQRGLLNRQHLVLQMRAALSERPSEN